MLIPASVLDKIINIMKHTLCVLTLLLFIPALLSAQETDYAKLRDQLQALGELTEPPKTHLGYTFNRGNTLKDIFYDGIEYEGKPTRVYAWLGVPNSNPGEKVPGVVLVHGGGGTAFKEWVELWNAQGFAAISIAVEGQVDIRGEGTTDARRGSWGVHEWAGPKRTGIFDDTDKPLKEQWMYQALAQTVLANSLLRSLPEVDENKVGLMGISWGGVITSGVIGIDNRFAFAIPTYGCGHLFDAGNQWGRALGDNEVYKQVYDPMNWMGRVTMPVQWLSWPKDSHFPLDSQRACYLATKGPNMVTLIPGMGHSHQAGWNPPDSYAFAKSVVETGKPWAKFERLDVGTANITATFKSSKPFDKATLFYTADTGFTGDREWLSQEAKLEKKGYKWVVTTELPKGAVGWLVNVNSGKLTVSSDYQGK
ncbi:MAG: acetylxylan esterase [Planctomycetaceae bacterium]|nr:acetylxylan esterase [Planctomycetaceae bacterium]